MQGRLYLTSIHPATEQTSSRQFEPRTSPANLHNQSREMGSAILPEYSWILGGLIASVPTRGTAGTKALGKCVSKQPWHTSLLSLVAAKDWHTVAMKCGLMDDMTMKEFQEKEYLHEVTPVMAALG